MPSLISATERAVLTGIFDNIFDTFERNIVVYKEPTKTLVSPPPSENIFGFGPNQQQEVYTYQPVSGVYPALIRYGDPNQAQNADNNAEINAAIFSGPVSIKVRRDCRDFINDGPTNKLIVDGRAFLLDSDERRQSFLDSEYYVFKLRATK